MGGAFFPAAVELPVQLSGELGDEVDGPGNIRFLKTGDVPVEQIIRIVADAESSVLNEQLLFDHVVDIAAIESGHPLGVFGKGVDIPLDLVLVLLGHLDIDLFEILADGDGLVVIAESSLCLLELLLPKLLGVPCFQRPLSRLHQRNEVIIKLIGKGILLLHIFGKEGAQADL